MAREAAVATARALVGSPFRLHGRDCATGLDCVGLAALAYDLKAVPRGYALRTASATALEAALHDAGFCREDKGPMPGDLIVLRPGPGQLHLAIWTGTSLIHADASVGRVVETPGSFGKPVAIWRKC